MADIPHPLRVLHVIPTLTGGGAEKFLCALAAAFDTSVVRTAIMPVYPTRVPLEQEQRQGLEIIEVNRRGRYDPGFLGRMLRGMRAFRPDIVHTHLHNGKYWGRLTALAAHVPIVVFTEHSPQGERRNLPEMLVDRVVNYFTDGVITFTDRQRSALEEQEHVSALKLHVIENGIRLPPEPDARKRLAARVRLGVDESQFALLVVSRLEKVKNAALAVRAIGELRPPAREKLRLIVIGDGSQKTALQQLAASLGVAEHIAFMGHRDDAVQLLYGGDALLLPSLVEGMPLAALEAMSVGVPVITTPWPGAAELLGDGAFGIVLEDWRADTAAATLERVMTRRSDLREMGERARAVTRVRYDIRRAARAHERYYIELARGKGLR